jgi:hypothetical protein
MLRLLVEAETLRLQAQLQVQLGASPAPTLPMRDLSPLGG